MYYKILLTAIISSSLSFAAYAAGDVITGYYYDPGAGIVIPQYDNASPNPQDAVDEGTPVVTDPVTPPVVIVDPATRAQAQAQVDQAQAAVTASQAAYNTSKAVLEAAEANVAKKQGSLLKAQEELSQAWDDVLNPKNLGSFISALLSLPKKTQNVNTAQSQLQTAQQQLSSAQNDFTLKSTQLGVAQKTLDDAQAALDILG